MVHPNMFPKAIVRMNVKPNEVKHDVKSDEMSDDVKSKGVKSDDQLVDLEIDVCAQFINKQKFMVRELMLQ